MSSNDNHIPEDKMFANADKLLQRDGLFRQRRSFGRPEQILPHGRHHPALRHVSGLRARLHTERDLQVPRQPEAAPRPGLRHLARRARGHGRRRRRRTASRRSSGAERTRPTRSLSGHVHGPGPGRFRSGGGLRAILGQINEATQDFASATISSVQAGNGQMAYLATFNASKSRSIWNGALAGVQAASQRCDQSRHRRRRTRMRRTTTGPTASLRSRTNTTRQTT